MPLYEYECAQCQKTHEALQKFSDPPLETCPECGGPVKKIMSRTSFQLKGTGWYASDYKKPSAPSSPAPAASTSAKSSTNKGNSD